MDDLQQRVGRIDELIGRIDQSAPQPVRENVRELVDTLLAVHGTALERLLDSLYEAGGQEAVDDASADEVVGSLLLLHGLHPLRREARVHRALESVRPYLHSHGGDVELVEVTDDGELKIRLQGSCDGCPSSSATLQYAIEEAVYKAAPDILDIHVLDKPLNGRSEQAAAVHRGNGHAGAGDAFIPMSALTSEPEWDGGPIPDLETNR